MTELFSTLPRHAILVTIGSAGDVHPFVGVGVRLRQRGYRVTLVTTGYFRKLAEQAGLEFIDPLPHYDFEAAIRNPDLWHPQRGPRTVIETGVRPLLEPTYRIIAERFQPGRTIVVASSLALGARVAQDKLGVPTVTVHLSPSIFRSDYEGAHMPGMLVHRGPAWFRHVQWRLADLVIDRLVCPWLNAFRRTLGLPPVSRVFRDWWHSPLRVLGMFTDWFAAPQYDWPSQVRLVGFPLYDERGVAEPSDELWKFVDGGDPPLVFTPGSGNVFGGEFFRAAIEACRRLDRRGLLLTRFAEQVPRPLPPLVHHFDYAPFSWLLPRAGALVHHGGIGTLAQGLAAGVPQLIMPMAYDQFDNAARVKSLGVGLDLPRRSFRADAVAQSLRMLFEEPGVKRNCREIAQWFAGVDGLANACDEIDEMASVK